MKYGSTSNWKYVLMEDYSRDLLSCMHYANGKIIGLDRKTYVDLANGRINIYRGYRWNGADWFPDFEEVMEASLVHDALCQLIRDREIAKGWRLCADRGLYCMVKERGPRWMASMMYHALRGDQSFRYLGGAFGGIVGFVRGLFLDETFEC